MVLSSETLDLLSLPIFIIVLFSFKIACILKKYMYLCKCKNFINSTILTIKTNII